MMTYGWINLIGSADKRVLVGSNMNVTNPSNIVPGPENATYTEQVQWRDAATGKLLAASDYFTPMSEGGSSMAWVWRPELPHALRWSHNSLASPAPAY